MAPLRGRTSPALDPGDLDGRRRPHAGWRQPGRLHPPIGGTHHHQLHQLRGARLTNS
jgi:hypothetical protein